MRGGWYWLLLAALLLGAAPGWTTGDLPAGLDALLAAAAPQANAGERVAAISARFLGTPYRAGTLGGGPDRREELVVALDAVDCFTFLDYVEALRRCNGPGEFRARLVEVRYRDGIITWAQRRHFFTDWAAAPGGLVTDVTGELGGVRTRRTAKRLNLREDGTLYLPGVAVQERTVSFIPVAVLDSAMLARLQPGDYLGIYAPDPGLDVSHVGIVVRRDDHLYLRHASSRAAARVIDSDLREYLTGKPGVMVLRPR